MSVQRSWCFTLNNPSEEETQRIDDAIGDERVRYLIYGYETGDSGTPHLQGYVEFARPLRLAGVKKLLVARMHLEPRRGAREAAAEYCKKDGNWIEFGEWDAGGQGARNDLKKLMAAVAKPSRDVRQIMEEEPLIYSRNQRFIEKYQALCERDETREFRTVTTELFIGDAGSGKSRTAREMAPAAFTVNPEDAFPFDGYDGEQDIIIDDFEGQLKYKQLLKVLDGHQLRINVKGSHRYAKWTRVFITTNEEPSQWYQRGLTPALARRITNVTRFGNEEAGNTMPPLEDHVTNDLCM